MLFVFRLVGLQWPGARALGGGARRELGGRRRRPPRLLGRAVDVGAARRARPFGRRASRRRGTTPGARDPRASGASASRAARRGDAHDAAASASRAASPSPRSRSGRCSDWQARRRLRVRKIRQHWYVATSSISRTSRGAAMSSLWNAVVRRRSPQSPAASSGCRADAARRTPRAAWRARAPRRGEEDARARARGADDVRLGRSDARAKRAERGCAILSRRRRLGDERATRGCGATSADAPARPNDTAAAQFPADAREHGRVLHAPPPKKRQRKAKPKRSPACAGAAANI